MLESEVTLNRLTALPLLEGPVNPQGTVRRGSVWKGKGFGATFEVRKEIWRIFGSSPEYFLSVKGGLDGRERILEHFSSVLGRPRYDARFHDAHYAIWKASVLD